MPYAWENKLLRYRAYLSFCLLSLLIGCADNGLKEGRGLIEQGKTQEGLGVLRAGTQKAPEDTELRQYYFAQRERAVTRLLDEAQEAMNAGDTEGADAAFKQLTQIDPKNPRAAALRIPLDQLKQRAANFSQAEAAFSAGQLDAAESGVKRILAKAPTDAGALALQDKIQSARKKAEEAQKLAPSFYTDKVTLEFQNAPMRSVFDVLSRESGINFVFSPGVPLDREITLFAKQTPISNAVSMLVEGHNLKRKVINANTLQISPEQPPPQQQLSNDGEVVKAFYLTNADPKRVQTLLETVMALKNVYIDDPLNLVIVHGSPLTVDKAAKLISMVDLAQPEVMLDVEVLEVKRDEVRNLGIQYPNQLTLLNVPPTASSVTTPTGTTVTTPSTTPLTLDSLRHISRGKIAINNPAVNFQDDTGDAKILANPRIRVKNRDDALVQIGEKVPVFTSTTTPTGVVSNSVSYLDVGLKLNVKPSVLLDDTVQIQLSLEVSNILNQVSNNGTLAYQVGTRNASTTLRLADGETQVLAGLISDEDREAANRVPGLGSLPLLGRLFSNHNDSRNRTEIILLITPHLVRNLDVRQAGQAELTLADTGDPIGSVVAGSRDTPVTTLPVPMATSEPQPRMPAGSQPPALPQRGSSDAQPEPMVFPSAMPSSANSPASTPIVAPTVIPANNGDSSTNASQDSLGNNQTIVMPPGMKLPPGFKPPPGVTVVPSSGSTGQ